MAWVGVWDTLGWGGVRVGIWDVGARVGGWPGGWPGARQAWGRWPGTAGLARAGWVAWTLPAERWRGTRPGPRVLRARRRARAQKHAHADKKTLIWCCSLFFGKKQKNLSKMRNLAKYSQISRFGLVLMLLLVFPAK